MTYDVSAGIAERAPNAVHVLVMHLGKPAPGSCRCDGIEQRRVMTVGDMDFVPVGCAATWQDDVPGRVLNVKLSASLFQSTAEAMRVKYQHAVNLRPQLHLRDARLEHLGWALVADLEAEHHHDWIFAESVSHAIAAHIVGQSSSARPVEVMRGLSRRQFSRVVDYIQARLETKLSLAELATVVGLSASHFNALFKNSAGVTIHQFIMRRRVDCALLLLSRSGARLTDVAEQAGFADQSHMSRCVRRMTGLTPSVIVRRNR